MTHIADVDLNVVLELCVEPPLERRAAWEAAEGAQQDVVRDGDVAHQFEPG
jgi:hypothetical protein